MARIPVDSLIGSKMFTYFEQSCADGDRVAPFGMFKFYKDQGFNIMRSFSYTHYIVPDDQYLLLLLKIS